MRTLEDNIICNRPGKLGKGFENVLLLFMLRALMILNVNFAQIGRTLQKRYGVSPSGIEHRVLN